MTRSDWLRVALTAGGMAVFLAGWTAVVAEAPPDMQRVAALAALGLLVAWLASRGTGR